MDGDQSAVPAALQGLEQQPQHEGVMCQGERTDRLTEQALAIRAQSTTHDGGAPGGPFAGGTPSLRRWNRRAEMEATSSTAGEGLLADGVHNID